MISVVTGVHVQVVACLVQVGVGVYLFFDRAFNYVQLILDIVSEAVQSLFGFVKERHICGVEGDGNGEAEGGVDIARFVVTKLC